MRGRWETVQLSIKTRVVKCPECCALVLRGEDQTTHMEAHFPEPPEPSYEFAPGVTVGRPPSALRQIRDIFRLRPPPEPVVYTAEQVDFEDRGQRFRAAMERINGPGGDHAAHG